MDKDAFNRGIEKQYSDSLNSISDLFGDGYDSMSNQFYLLNNRYLHWLDNDPNIAISEKEIHFRKKFYNVLKTIGPGVLKCSQVYENRKKLNNPGCQEEDAPVIIPDSPVIFAANHGFHDDVLATVLAVGRPVYLIWGSLPLLFNTVDGFATALVGCVCVNRKNPNSRKALLSKALKALDYGISVVYFPEGGWNKTSEQLVLPLWKGVYDLALKSKCPVIPIAHYIRDPEILSKRNVIHTVIDDPLYLYDYGRDDALQLLRDNLASWIYKMMEVYGRADRASEMVGFSNSIEKWEAHLEKRMKGVARYDSTIEKHADYRSKELAYPENVYFPIAHIEEKNISPWNIHMKLEAQKILDERSNSDFQRLF